MDQGTIRVHLNKIFELIHKSLKIAQDFILLGELLKVRVSFGLDGGCQPSAHANVTIP